MNALLRFEDRVALVTGAGSSPGLGRSYAIALAERGARVIVNDVSSQIGTDGLTAAERVAAEIVALGGEAIGVVGDVSTSASAHAIVASALQAWGRVDILVNNAGINIPATFAEITDADIERTIDVHLMGHIWMSRAVWQPMIDQGYGRILNTSSAVMLGLERQVLYGAAKGGIFSLTRGLAIEGHAHGIVVNTLAPAAGTAGSASLAEADDQWMTNVYMPGYPPDLVAPAALFLVHESCTVTAEWVSSGGGLVSAGYFSQTAGIEDRQMTLEDVLRRRDEVFDRTRATEAPDPIEANRANPFVPRAYRPRA